MGDFAAPGIGYGFNFEEKRNIFYYNGDMRADSLTRLGMKYKLGDIMHFYGYAEDLAKLRCLRE